MNIRHKGTRLTTTCPGAGFSLMAEMIMLQTCFLKKRNNIADNISKRTTGFAFAKTAVLLSP